MEMMSWPSPLLRRNSLVKWDIEGFAVYKNTSLSILFNTHIILRCSFFKVTSYPHACFQDGVSSGDANTESNDSDVMDEASDVSNVMDEASDVSIRLNRAVFI